jgi:hypothetical protein
MQPPHRLVRLGSILFVLWGVLHVGVGVVCAISYLHAGPLGLLTHFGWSADPRDALAGPNVRLASHIALDFSIVLVGYGVLAIWAARLMWRGEALGFWLNAILLGIADAAFVIALMIPGHVPVSEGIWGPALYVLGVLFSVLGYWRARAAR